MHGHVVVCMAQAISVTDVRDMYGGTRLLWELSVLHSHRDCLLVKHIAYPDPISGWSCCAVIYRQRPDTGHVMITLHYSWCALQRTPVL